MTPRKNFLLELFVVESLKELFKQLRSESAFNFCCHGTVSHPYSKREKEQAGNGPNQRPRKAQSTHRTDLTLMFEKNIFWYIF